MAVGEHHALVFRKPGEAGQGAEIPVVEGVLHHPLLAREIEVARLDAPVAVRRIAPIIHLADAADEKLRIHHGVVATEVVAIHVVERIGITQTAAFVEVFLDVVDERPVAIELALVGQAEEILVNMLRRVETHAVVVHRVAKPVDPADHEIPRVLGGQHAGRVVGVFVVIARMPNEGNRVGRVTLRGEASDLKAVVKLQHDIHQADQFLVQRATRAIVGIPLEHPGRTPIAARLAAVDRDVKVLRMHSRVGAEIRTIAGVVEDDVRVDLDVRLVGIVHQAAQGGAGTVTGFPISSLGHVSQVKAVERVVTNISPVGERVGTADGRLARGRSPDGLVADLRDFRKALIHLIPPRLEELDDHLRSDCRGKDGKTKAA